MKSRPEIIVVFLFLVWVIIFAYNNGKSKEQFMLQTIEMTGAASDSECQEIAELFGFNGNPKSCCGYSFWDYIDAGTSSIKAPAVVMIIAEYSYPKKK